MGGRGPVRVLVLVGCGKMGSAMLRGWVAGTVASRFLVVEPTGIPSDFTSVTEIAWYPGVDALADDLSADAVVFAVKPQVVDSVAPSYRRWARPGTLFLSIVAGKTVAGLTRHLGTAAIIRTMPNTPAAIGRGITVAVANQRVTPAQRALAHKLLVATGAVEWVDDESLLDAVTAVSGSGPAYVFLLAESLAKAGAAAGLPPDLAARLARATVAGSGELMQRSTLDPVVLRESVTSPGGTTAAALGVLMSEERLDQLMRDAVAAAARRSGELAD